MFWHKDSQCASHVKFCQNRSNGCGDIAILQYSTMAAAAILDFQKFKFLTADTLERPICVILPNFIKIGQFIAEIWRFFDFLKMAAVRHVVFRKL